MNQSQQFAPRHVIHGDKLKEGQRRFVLFVLTDR